MLPCHFSPRAHFSWHFFALSPPSEHARLPSSLYKGNAGGLYSAERRSLIEVFTISAAREDARIARCHALIMASVYGGEHEPPFVTKVLQPARLVHFKARQHSPGITPDDISRQQLRNHARLPRWRTPSGHAKCSAIIGLCVRHGLVVCG